MLLHTLQSILGYSENVSPGPPALLFGEIQLHHPISSSLSQEKSFLLLREGSLLLSEKTSGTGVD